MRRSLAYLQGIIFLSLIIAALWSSKVNAQESSMIAAYGKKAPEKAAKAGMKVEKIVSTDWLNSNLENQDIRIVDVRQNITDYWANHIPGAVYMNPDSLRLSDKGVPVMLIPPEILKTMLGQMGITPGTTVIVYTERNDFKSGYLTWALDYIGHENAAILEGGYGKWADEGKQLTQEYPKIKPMNYDSSRPMNSSVRANLEEVRLALDEGYKDTILLDVRPYDAYTGEKGSWIRTGHIKGAISRPWSEDLNADGTWKDKTMLMDVYKNLGATPDKTIIVSCGQGQMSANTYITLKYLLGYPKVKNYDGSFNEWSSILSLPVVKGDQPGM